MPWSGGPSPTGRCCCMQRPSPCEGCCTAACVPGSGCSGVAERAAAAGAAAPPAACRGCGAAAASGIDRRRRRCLCRRCSRCSRSCRAVGLYCGAVTAAHAARFGWCRDSASDRAGEVGFTAAAQDSKAPEVRVRLVFGAHRTQDRRNAQGVLLPCAVTVHGIMPHYQVRPAADVGQILGG
jgi:hypothetical protein